MIIKTLSALLYLIGDSKMGESSLFYLTLATHARSIFSLFDIGTKIDKLKDQKELPIYIITYIFVYNFWNKLNNERTFNFINSNMLFFLTYYLFSRIKLEKKETKSIFKWKLSLRKWDKNLKENMDTATVTTNIIVFFLYWVGILFVDPSERIWLQNQIRDSFTKKSVCYNGTKKDIACINNTRLALLNSLTSHLFLPLYWMFTLYSKKTKINWEGIKLTQGLLVFQMTYVSIYYLLTRSRMGSAIDELKNNMNKWKEIGGNFLIFDDFFSYTSNKTWESSHNPRVSSKNNDQQKEELSFKMILNIKRIKDIFIKSRFYNSNNSYFVKTIKDNEKEVIPYLVPNTINDANFLRRFNDDKLLWWDGKDITWKQNCVSSTGFVPYSFMRLNPLQKNIDYFKKYQIYLMLVLPYIIYGIDLGIKKIKK